MPPLPDPQLTPTRFLSTWSKSTPPLARASSTAMSAYWVKRSYFRASDLGMWSRGSKFLSSQANFVLNFSGSNFVMGPAPLTPASSDFQKSSTLFPIGVKAPIPVITTLLIAVVLSRSFCFPYYQPFDQERFIKAFVSARNFKVKYIFFPTPLK